MKQYYSYSGNKVFIVKALTLTKTEPNGRITRVPLVDKLGTWIQVEFEDGHRQPIVQEHLVAA
jgi:hypothetical protein